MSEVVQKFRDRVRQITHRNRGMSMARRHQELRWFFHGWVSYFRLVPIEGFFSELDKWIRRRIRSCYWKQWRRRRTRIANLRKLGIREHEAVTHGVSSKGPHEALSVAFFKESDLVSLFWSKLAARERTAYVVRTRLLGGVGGVRSNAAPIPIFVRRSFPW